MIASGLPSRIVGCDDAEVGVLIGGCGHQRALRAIAISAATEDDDELSRAKARGQVFRTFSNASGVCA
jgi:hypothetical protein